MTAKIKVSPVLVMSTEDAPVTPGGEFSGFVSGDRASVAGVVSSVFDLGRDWNQYGIAQIFIYPRAYDLTGIAVSSSMNPSGAVATRLNHAFSGSPAQVYYSSPVASNCSAFFVRPAGRFLVVSSNSAGIQGDDAQISLAVYPN